MQASGKEALPLFGTLAVWGGEREGGKRDRLRRCERVHFSQFWISDPGARPPWESAEHQGRPNDALLPCRTREKTRAQEVTRPSQRSKLDVMTVE